MSTAESTQSTNTETKDERIVASDRAIAVNAEGNVTLNQVPDEVFDLGGEVVAALKDVAALETRQDRSEVAQLGDRLIQFGIPAALLGFVALAFMKGSK